MTAPKDFQENAARAGFKPGPGHGGRDLSGHPRPSRGALDRPGGPEKNLDILRTEDGRLNIAYPEMARTGSQDHAAAETAALERNPEWPLDPDGRPARGHQRQHPHARPGLEPGPRACTLAMHPEDADTLGLDDGQTVKVITEAGEVEIELEVTETTRPGTGGHPPRLRPGL